MALACEPPRFKVPAIRVRETRLHAPRSGERPASTSLPSHSAAHAESPVLGGAELRSLGSLGDRSASGEGAGLRLGSPEVAEFFGGRGPGPGSRGHAGLAKWGPDVGHRACRGRVPSGSGTGLGQAGVRSVSQKRSGRGLLDAELSILQKCGSGGSQRGRCTPGFRGSDFVGAGFALSRGVALRAQPPPFTLDILTCCYKTALQMFLSTDSSLKARWGYAQREKRPCPSFTVSLHVR